MRYKFAKNSFWIWKSDFYSAQLGIVLALCKKKKQLIYKISLLNSYKQRKKEVIALCRKEETYPIKKFRFKDDLGARSKLLKIIAKEFLFTLQCFFFWLRKFSTHSNIVSNIFEIVQLYIYCCTLSS